MCRYRSNLTWSSFFNVANHKESTCPPYWPQEAFEPKFKRGDATTPPPPLPYTHWGHKIVVLISVVYRYQVSVRPQSCYSCVNVLMEDKLGEPMGEWMVGLNRGDDIANMKKVWLCNSHCVISVILLSPILKTEYCLLFNCLFKTWPNVYIRIKAYVMFGSHYVIYINSVFSVIQIEFDFSIGLQELSSEMRLGMWLNCTPFHNIERNYNP